MTDAEMRGYLLGQLPEADAARIDAQLLENEDVFDELRAVEAELFDDYAAGRLTNAEQARFVERYGAGRGRILTAHALARHAARGASATSAARRSWMPLAAAAVLVTVVGASLWMRQQPTPAGTPTPSAPAATGATAASTPRPVPIAVALTLGTSRAESKMAAVQVPRDATVLELHVRLDPADRFDRYAVDVRSSAGDSVWHDDQLHASTDNGEPVIVASVPAASVPDGAYEIGVRGVSASAPGETLGFTTMRFFRQS